MDEASRCAGSIKPSATNARFVLNFIIRVISNKQKYALVKPRTPIHALMY
jgi:hypothetical protein